MYKTDHSKLLIDIFEKNHDKSYSAPILVEELKDKMNKATVYRQLKSLEDDSFIYKTYNNVTNAYEYQLAADCHNHLHLKCTVCGRIIHLKCHEANSFIDHILKNHDFLVNQYSSTFYGICKECRN